MRMSAFQACGGDPRALAILSGTRLHEYFGNLETNPGAADLLLDYMMNSERQEHRDGIFSDDEAAEWVGVCLDEWEFEETYTVRCGYTARYNIWYSGEFKLTVRYYRHDGHGREAGTPETSVWFEHVAE